MKVLLHSCCGPCASACVPRLEELGHDVTMLFANSNISDEKEFEKRKAAAQRLAEADGIVMESLPYDHGEWIREVAVGYENEPEKGGRCERCFRYNLAKTAAYAAKHGFAAFTTSLTVSPHKVSTKVFEAGRAVVGMGNEESGVRNGVVPLFLEENFKKHEGFKLSLRRSTELGLYRQDWCGCEYSKRCEVEKSGGK